MDKVGQFPLVEYAQLLNHMDIYNSKICKLLCNSNHSDGLQLTFGFPTIIIHDIESASFILNKAIFANTFFNIDGQFTQIFAENWIRVQFIEVKQYYIQVKIILYQQSQCAINLAINAIISIFYKSFTYQNLSNQQLQILYKSNIDFEQQQKRYSKFLQLSQLKGEDLQQESKKLCQQIFTSIKSQRFTLIATSSNENIINFIKETILTSTITIQSNIQDNSYLYFQRLENPKLYQQLIINENQDQSNTDFEICTVESIMYLTDIFSNHCVNESFIYIAQWLQHKSGPLVTYMKNQLIPEQIANQSVVRLQTYEKYIFLQVEIYNVPEIYSEQLLSIMQDILQHPVQQLICRSRQFLDQIIEENIQSLHLKTSFHDLIVNDIMYNSFDQVNVHAQQCNSIHNWLGPQQYFQGIQNIVIHDIWSSILDDNNQITKQYQKQSFKNQNISIYQYLQIKPKQKTQNMKNIFTDKIKFQENNSNLDIFIQNTYKKQYFGILSSINRTQRILKLLQDQPDILQFIQQLFLQITQAQAILFQVIAGIYFSPYQTIINIIKPNRRSKSSLDDEALEIFNQCNFNLSPFQELYQLYKNIIKNGQSDKIIDSRGLPKLIISKSKEFYTNTNDRNPNFNQHLTLDIGQLTINQSSQLTQFNILCQIQQQAYQYYNVTDLQTLFQNKILFKNINVIRYQAVYNILIDQLSQIPCFKIQLIYSFETSHIQQDLQYLVQILVYMYNLRSPNTIKFTFLQNKINVEVNSHTAADFQFKLEQFFLIISQKFTVDDFATIIKIEALTGLLMLLQQIIFMNIQQNSSIFIEQFSSFQNDINFNLKAIQNLKSYIHNILEHLQNFKKRLLPTYQSVIARQENQYSIVLQENINLPSCIIQIHLNNKNILQNAIIREILQIILLKESQLGNFQILLDSSLSYIQIYLQAENRYILNFLHVLKQQNFKSMMQQKYKFYILNQLITNTRLSNLIQFFDNEFNTLVFQPFVITSIFCSQKQDQDYDKLLYFVNNSQINCLSFNMPPKIEMTIINHSKVSLRILPPNITKLVSQIQNQIFNGIQLKSADSIKYLKDKFLKLKTLQEQTNKLSEEIRVSSNKILLIQDDIQHHNHISIKSQSSYVNHILNNSIVYNIIQLEDNEQQLPVFPHDCFNSNRFMIPRVMKMFNICQAEGKSQTRDNLWSFGEIPIKDGFKFNDLQQEQITTSFSSGYQDLISKKHLLIHETVQYRYLLIQSLLSNILNIKQTFSFIQQGQFSYISFALPSTQQPVFIPILNSINNFQGIRGIRSKSILPLKNKINDYIYLEGDALDPDQYQQLIDQIIIDNFNSIFNILKVDHQGKILESLFKIQNTQ
ncbi:hypothetical protein SS50377_22120 [Spironucleus salmonicida]|uniref:Uncharacterized protein n=1 Tax=Spironucleus salmonicida TaxID=348837 RepID=V6LM49_9EUKA|nr:hypothetical protein SS50377_22120 [Spironucleus salmonicida]|eukprot:EST45720.1 Hypothetical protein SS50377_14291 [Spironucleus salmonicida]